MSFTRWRRSVSSDRELRLWKVGYALTVTFIVAILAAGGVLSFLITLLDFEEIDTTAKLDAKTLFEIVKLSFGVVAGAGALVALVVAYRRQRVDEAGAHREATRLHTERFTQAVEQLGSDAPAVSLGGVHALAGLADDAPDDALRQTCIDVLCAYLRLPFPDDPGDPPALPDGSSPGLEWEEKHQREKDRYHAVREVRRTILRLIGDHYRIPKGTHRSWQGCNLDLTGVVIDGEIDFGGATFAEGSTVSFSGATFTEDGSVSFHRATFSGGAVSFMRATFSGMINFGGATFSEGEVSFVEAEFSGGLAVFNEAVFVGGTVSFIGAKFSGGFASFGRVTLSDGHVAFSGADFASGVVSFHEATFSGAQVSFIEASGPAPDDLLAAIRNADTADMHLPDHWLP
ncbi:pentapeptide repeat-containing protein [Streptomyces sp. UH6]|uniref:pentapeptide repeat-containing protein n=1 Tax=Streptomyces sp. UH6 TaxID=2748379 RepID=UPI0015D51EEE|nr:pentapeptide repeat-containing protein [Streptomyces sp. UH6]NYV73168.1 pentapeptide repeat-containing protein [Streptomyces sp. UH6]